MTVSGSSQSQIPPPQSATLSGLPRSREPLPSAPEPVATGGAGSMPNGTTSIERAERRIAGVARRGRCARAPQARRARGRAGARSRKRTRRRSRARPAGSSRSSSAPARMLAGARHPRERGMLDRERRVEVVDRAASPTARARASSVRAAAARRRVMSASRASVIRLACHGLSTTDRRTRRLRKVGRERNDERHVVPAPGELAGEPEIADPGPGHARADVVARDDEDRAHSASSQSSVGRCGRELGAGGARSRAAPSTSAASAPSDRARMPRQAEELAAQHAGGRRRRQALEREAHQVVVRRGAPARRDRARRHGADAVAERRARDVDARSSRAARRASRGRGPPTP